MTKAGFFNLCDTIEDDACDRIKAVENTERAVREIMSLRHDLEVAFSSLDVRTLTEDDMHTTEVAFYSTSALLMGVRIGLCARPKG